MTDEENMDVHINPNIISSSSPSFSLEDVSSQQTNLSLNNHSENEMIEKYIKIQNDFVKTNNSEANTNPKNSNSKYNKDHNGEFILNAKLNANKCSDRGNRNYLRIIDIVSN